MNQEAIDSLRAERDSVLGLLDMAMDERDHFLKQRDELAAENKVLREALLTIARKAEALKKECGDDPESPQAIRNGRYMHLSYLAHAAITKEATK